MNHLNKPNCVDIDECVYLNKFEIVCKNNGTCVNTNGSYECICDKNHYGRNCELTIFLSYLWSAWGPWSGCLNENGEHINCGSGYHISFRNCSVENKCIGTMYKKRACSIDRPCTSDFYYEDTFYVEENVVNFGLIKKLKMINLLIFTIGFLYKNI